VVTSCTARAYVDRIWCKDRPCLGWGGRACILHASSSETSRLPYSSSGHQRQMNWYAFFAATNISSLFHFLESGLWTEKRLRDPTMRYITRPVAIASIDATGFLQPFSANARVALSRLHGNLHQNAGDCCSKWLTPDAFQVSKV
jgi:hypothetical protein